MPIPDYQTLMLPLLKLIAKHGALNRNDAVHLISDELKLTDEERREPLPSGRVTIIRSRVGWARTYLRKAGLIDYPKRGLAEITERGRRVLGTRPEKIDLPYLRQFSEFCEFENSSSRERRKELQDESRTPEEILEGAYNQLKNEVLKELLDKIKASTPEFFEELVVT